MGRKVVFFSLGTNLGDRISNLRYGLKGLSDCGSIRATSPIYETEPWGYTDPNRYLNLVVQIETQMKASELMTEIENIERKCGRAKKLERTPGSYQARKLDIDILFYESEIFEKIDLKIPHPRLHLRNFVLFPLADIAPDFVHPKYNISIAELKNNTKDTSEIHRIAQRI